MSATQAVRIGSTVEFPGNGVRGTVYNVTTAYNTGDTIVQWSDGENGCSHTLQSLTVVKY